MLIILILVDLFLVAQHLLFFLEPVPTYYIPLRVLWAASCKAKTEIQYELVQGPMTAVSPKAQGREGFRIGLV